MKAIKLIKRWRDMFSGKSNFNVTQGQGQYYSKREVNGYYNDLRAKVNDRTKLNKSGIPVNTTVAGVVAYFPISIFQYALGLYDKWYETADIKYLEAFMKVADWAVENQKENGMWDCMATLKDRAHETQSSMCQGQGISVLARAYTETGEQEFKDALIKATDFMLTKTENGGTATYDEKKIVLQEYVSSENLAVMNGWIFSIFGLYDSCLITKSRKYKNRLKQTVQTLKEYLPKYDRGYWSDYDTKGTIASPAYHSLHIELLKTMADLFDEPEFENYSKKFEEYRAIKSASRKALITKAKQKLFPNNYYDINTSLVD